MEKEIIEPVIIQDNFSQSLSLTTKLEVAKQSDGHLLIKYFDERTPLDIYTATFSYDTLPASWKLFT